MKNNKLCAQWNRFSKAEGGNVAIFVGLGMIVLVATVGLALDFSRGHAAQTKATTAADAAALAAVVEAKAVLGGAKLSVTTSSLQAKAAEAGRIAARKHFETATADLSKSVTKLTGTYVVDVTASGVTSTVSFSGEMPMAFGAALGKSSVQIANKVVANGGGGSYLDLHIVLDNSASMGVGATPADLNTMLTDPKMYAPSGGCVFACHVGGEGGVAFATDDYAKTAGYQLRIDVLKTATQSMLTQANTKKVNADQFQFTLYSFANRLSVLRAATTDYTALANGVTALRLTQTEGGTNFAYTIGTELADKLPAASGSGLSAKDRKTLVMIVTDGNENSLDKLHSDYQYTAASSATVVDWRPTETWAHYLDRNYVPFASWTYASSLGSGTAVPYDGGDFKVQAMNPAVCDKLKAKGATVAVLYVIPWAPPAGYTGIYADLFQYITTQIQGAASSTLEKCASDPSLFVRADSPAEITTAMNTIFNKFSGGSARLTKWAGRADRLISGAAEFRFPFDYPPGLSLAISISFGNMRSFHLSE